MRFSPDPNDSPAPTGDMMHYWSASGETRFLNREDMRRKGLKVENVPGDGNCLVTSFCDLYNKTVSGWLPEMRARVAQIAGEFRIPIPLQLDVYTLRRVFSAYLRKHWNHYWDEEMFRSEMIEEVKTPKSPYQTDDEYKSLIKEMYTRHVSGNNNWLRAPEIDAGAEIFGVRLLVFINAHIDPFAGTIDYKKMYESPLALVFTPTNPPSYTQEWLIYHESMRHYQYVTPEPTVDGPGGRSFLGGPPPPGPPPGPSPGPPLPPEPAKRPSAEDTKKAVEQIDRDAAKVAARVAARAAVVDQKEQLRQIRQAQAAQFEARKSPPAPLPASKPVVEEEEEDGDTRLARILAEVETLNLRDRGGSTNTNNGSAAEQQKSRIAQLLSEKHQEEDEDLQREEKERAEILRREEEQDAILAALEAMSTESGKSSTHPTQEEEADSLIAKLVQEEEEALAHVQMLQARINARSGGSGGSSSGGSSSGGNSSNKAYNNDDDDPMWNPRDA